MTARSVRCAAISAGATLVVALARILMFGLVGLGDQVMLGLTDFSFFDTIALTLGHEAFLCILESLLAGVIGLAISRLVSRERPAGLAETISVLCAVGLQAAFAFGSGVF